MLSQNSMIDTLKDFVARLNDLGVTYMITGSFAMHAYATGRLTYDIDAVIEVGSGDAAKFESRFLPDYYVDRVSIQNAVMRNSMFNMINLSTGVKVDCIIKKETGFESEKFTRRHQSEIDGFRFWVISKEDLILSKLDWAKHSLSEKQFLDLRGLLESGADTEFLRQQIARLRLDQVWAEFEKWKIRQEN